MTPGSESIGSRDKNLTGKKENIVLTSFRLVLALALLPPLAPVNAALAEEYYVIKSRSGVVRIVDHKPGGGATTVQGPFRTREEAEKALKPSPETKAPDLKP
jgi:hypothetical protein